MAKKAGVKRETRYACETCSRLMPFSEVHFMPGLVHFQPPPYPAYEVKLQFCGERCADRFFDIEERGVRTTPTWEGGGWCRAPSAGSLDETAKLPPQTEADPLRRPAGAE